MVRPLKWRGEILDLLCIENRLHYNEIIRQLNLNRNVFNRNIKSLIKDQFVKKEKKGKFTYFSPTYLGIIFNMVKEPFNEKIFEEYLDSIGVIAEHYDETLSDDELKFKIDNFNPELKELAHSLKGRTIYELLAWAKERRMHGRWIKRKDLSMSPFAVKFDKDLEHLEDRVGKR